MSRYRHQLPQLSGRLLLSDGGMETTFVFHEGIELPHFAAYVLLETTEGRRRLKEYYSRYLAIAAACGLGFVLDAPTWRANPDWAERIGHDRAALGQINAGAVGFLSAMRDRHDTPETPCVVSGVVGPRGDGYRRATIEAGEAQDYHAFQITTFADAGADMVTAYTLTSIGEAIGIVRAAVGAAIPCVISFTVETDGRLASGVSLQEAIETVDAETAGGASYFMLNCAHPTHFRDVLNARGPWLERVRGVKANASTRSHAELDECDTLDEGDPVDLAHHYGDLARLLPGLAVVGGCCGTDHRHVAAIAGAFGHLAAGCG